MQMINKVVIVALLASLASTQCSQGCLACSPNNACYFCDPVSGFYLNNTTCVNGTRTNCVLLNVFGGCLACAAPNYFLDSSTGNCVQVTPGQAIANCSALSAPNVCTSCATGFYLVNYSACLPVSSPIANCTVQDTNSTCSLCVTGFGLSNNRTACILLPQMNCLLTTPVKCATCKSGFNYGEGFSLAPFMRSVFSQSLASGLFSNYGFGGLTNLPFPVCYSITNCAQYNMTDYTCLRCTAGNSYNQTSRTCFANPLPRVIDYCAIYITPTTCGLCQNGYLLVSSTLCSPIVPIPNCNSYNLTATATQCTNCSNFTFQSSNGQCVTRSTWNLPNCVSYMPFSDGCAACATGFILTTDKKLCLAALSQCLSYAPSSASTVALTCTSCAQGYYLINNGASCAQGTIGNCVSFATNTGNCVTCANGYYLSANQCILASKIKNCQIYSQTQNNQCSQCQAGYAKWNVQQTCTVITPIANCITYNSPTTCSACADGYRATSGGLACNPVTINNCAAYTGVNCAKCVPGFIFSGANNCVAATSQQLINCASDNLVGTLSTDTPNAVVCKQCVQGAVPVVYNNAHMCTMNSIMIATNGGNALPTNCVAYQLSNPSTYVCSKCNTGFLLENGACVASCQVANQQFLWTLPTMSTAGMYTSSLQFQTSACMTIQVTNCQNMSPLAVQSSTTPAYACITCTAGNYAFVALNAPSALNLGAVQRTNIVPGLASCGTVPAVVTFCSYYFLNAAASQTACIKCNFGLTGLVVVGIRNCIRYTGTNCYQCAPNYHLNSNNCVLNTAMANCQIYDSQASAVSCLQCDNALAYLTVASSIGTCNARTYLSAACTTYKIDADSCIACSAGNTLQGGKCYTNLQYCITHGPLGASPFYECTGCDNTQSYINTVSGQRICTAVTAIPGCRFYSQSTANVCTDCQTGYTLTDNVCIWGVATQQSKGFCQNYNDTTCATCFYDSIKFTITTKCAAPTPIANCVVYTSLTACGGCASSYYLSSPTTCSLIPSSVNCAQYVPVDVNADGMFTTSDYADSTTVFIYTCNLCLSGYYIQNNTISITYSAASKSISYATCVKTNFPSIPNCATMNNNGSGNINNIDCQSGCQANYIPYSFDGLRICVPPSYFSGTNPWAIVPNCAYYGKPASGSNYACLACNFGYGLDSGSCVATCSGSKVMAKYTYSSDAANLGQYRINGRNVCITTTIINNCAIAVPQFSLSLTAATFAYVCAQCNTGYLPITSIDPTNTNIFTSANLFSPFNPQFGADQQITSPLMPFNEPKECVQVSATAFNGVTGVPIANCAVHGKITDASTVYTCNRCIDGYVGVIGPLTTRANTPSYINKCVSDPSKFSSNYNYNGFNQGSEILSTFGSIRSIFSVFACNDPTLTPTAFLGLKTTSPYNPIGWVSYNYINIVQVAPTLPASLGDYSVADTAKAIAYQKNIVCVDYSSSADKDLYLDSGQSGAGQVVSNCGLYIINTMAVVKPNTGSITVSDPLTKALICVACAPGYAATYSAYGSSPAWNYISACTLITNCPASNRGTMFNVCSSCAFAKDAAKNQIDYKTCELTTPIPNCFVSSGATTCRLCNPGYVLNTANTKCVLLPAQGNCNSWELQNALETLWGTQANGYLVLYNNDALIPMFTYNNFGGCSQCSGNNIMLIADHTFDNLLTTEWCVPSTPEQVVATPTAVTNCAVYGFWQTTTANTTVSCKTCNSGYILVRSAAAPYTYSCNINTDTGTYPKIANCAIIDGTSKNCLQCDSTKQTLLLGGSCLTFGSSDLTTANCLQWDFTNTYAQSTLYCKTCVSGYYLVNGVCTVINNGLANCGADSGTNTAGSCIACKHGYALTLSGATQSCTPLVASPSAASTMPHDPNCLTILGADWDNYNLKCSECAPGYFTTAGTASDVYCYRISARTSVANCASFGALPATYSATTATCTKCSAQAQFKFTSGVCSAITAVTNCYSYNADGTCNTCQTGFTLGGNTCTAITPVTNTYYTVPAATYLKDFPPNAPSFVGNILACNRIANCQTTTQYLGLASPWSLFFSCHACTVTGQIPFVFVNAGNGTYSGPTGLFSYALNSTGTNFGWYDGGNSVQCLQPVASSFHPSYGNFNFPANCALGSVNVWANLDSSHSNAAINVDLTKIGIICVACAPGFKAATANDGTGTLVPGMVSSCTRIANCQSSLTFNLCDQCMYGYVFLIDNSNTIDYSVCVPTSVQNCQIGNSNGNCVLCISGYYKNLDGLCEMFVSPNCNNPNSQNEPSLSINIIDALMYQPTRGCVGGCSSGWSAALQTTAVTVCQISPLFNSRPNGSAYTPNCKLYLMAITGSNTVLCSVCQAGFTLTTANTCILTPDGACRLAVSALVCQTCVSSNYLIINGVCTLKNIPNCNTYSASITTVLTCTLCNDGYYLLNNACTYGLIQGCAYYPSPVTCGRCQTDFALQTDITGKNYCVASPQPLNCYQVDTNQFNQYVFTCANCSPAFVNPTLVNIDYCLPVASVPNCASYDVKSTVSTSSYNCVQCNPGYYLEQGTLSCFPRTSASLVNCTVQFPYADACQIPTPAPVNGQQISSATFVPYNPQPAGVTRCVAYDGFLNCTLCDATSYLLNSTTCQLLEPSLLVQNCLSYFPNKTCSSCAASYVLSKGACFSVLGSNCQTVDPVKLDCISCQYGYGLFLVSGYNTCVQLNGTNCISWSPNFPYNCTLCSSGFVAINNTCLTVNTTVANCRFYSADGICSQCVSGYGLLFGNTTANVTNPTTGVATLQVINTTVCQLMSSLSLNGFQDPNCDSFILTPLGTCALCSAGYVLQNGICVNCTAGIACQVCSPLNPSVCLMCSVGYYMTQTGNCVLNNFVPNATNQTNSTNSTTNGTTNGTNQTNSTGGNSPFVPAASTVLFSHIIALLLVWLL